MADWCTNFDRVDEMNCQKVVPPSNATSKSNEQ